MTTALSNSDSSVPELLERFEQELIAAPDPQVVLERFQSLHPEMATRFRELAEAVQMLQETPFRPAAETASAGAESTSPARFGPYRVIRAIGRGGMGEVFEAVEEPLARRVAVKTIRRGQATGATTMLRFDRERRTLARLHHTNIVPIFATGCEGDLLYFAMPYLSGASLGQVIKTALSHGSSGSPLSNSSFEQLLQEAHSRSQSASEKTEPPVAPAPQPAAPGDGQAADAGAPARAPSSASAGANGAPVLSKAYIRTAVAVMAAVAEGVHHAHEAGVIHRDLKPSNIMVETSGHAWVLDFGLASLKRAAQQDVAAPFAFAIPAEPDASLTAGPIGTPPYMAPEQHQDGSQANARTDVWGLGVTLYELLTLQRAFASGRSVLEAEPKSPRQLNPHLDRDLEAVVLKALRKDPAHRYVTAGALADDLNRWLRHEPVSARPAAVPRRAWLWARRNKGYALAISLVLFGLVAITTGALAFGQVQHREALRQRLQRIQFAPRSEGWSDRLLALARSAHWGIRGIDTQVQGQALAALAGFDSRPVRTFPFRATALDFDPHTGHLWLAPANRPVQEWDPETNLDREAGPNGTGAFAFGRDGPLLVAPAAVVGSIEVHDARSGRLLRTLIAPLDGWDKVELVDQAVTPNGARVAASFQGNAGARGIIAAWDATSGTLLKAISVAKPSEVALTPDGMTLAAADEAGVVRVWTLHDGREVASLTVASTPISSLAFGPDPTRRPRSGAWLLAAGDVGGLITVWDPALKIPRSYCRGSHFQITLLAFSPDGLTLATSGQYRVNLWDSLTGRLLLTMEDGFQVSGLAFSPDGRRLATTRLQVDKDLPKVVVRELDDGRGVRTLRGLRGGLARIVLSPDGRRLAVISNEWQVGVWTLDDGRLLGVFEMPRGWFVENANVAFSPDGGQLVAAAGHEAQLWEISTGRLLWNRELPEGLSEAFRFEHAGRLLLARQETTDLRVPPFFDTSDPKKIPKLPRVIRIRDLLAADFPRPIAEITDIDLWVGGIVPCATAPFFIADGLAKHAGKAKRVVHAYDWQTGKKLWEVPNPEPDRDAKTLPYSVNFDPTGSVLLIATSQNGPDTPYLFDLLELPGRTFLGRISANFVGPRGTTWMTREGPDREEVHVYRLRERGRDDVLLEIPFESGAIDPAQLRLFSRDGRYILLSNDDGAIILMDLPNIRRRLTQIGLGW